MQRDKFRKGLRDTFDACLELSNKKNADYANEDDSFRNFRNSKVVGVDVGKGILVRLMDKVTRLGNLSAWCN